MSTTLTQDQFIVEMLNPEFKEEDWEFSWGTYEFWFTLDKFNEKRWAFPHAIDPVVFRKIVRTQTINGFTVPAPVKDWAEFGGESGVYYTPVLHHPDMARPMTYWELRDNMDTILLERGLIFKTKEDAVAVAKAMLGIDPST